MRGRVQILFYFHGGRRGRPARRGATGKKRREYFRSWFFCCVATMWDNGIMVYGLWLRNRMRTLNI